MTTVVNGRSETVSLPAGYQLSVTAPTGAARVTLVTDGGFVAVAASTTSTFGPFAVPKVYRVEARDGDVTYSTAPVDFPTATEARSGLVAGTGVTSIVKLTQAAYDLLDPPHATTLYAIVD